MITTILHADGCTYEANLLQGFDISLAVGTPGPRAWYVPDPQITPVVMGDFTGSVAAGGSVNFFNILFNPHGHGTHTECVGHITETKESINKCLHSWFFTARLVTADPQQSEEAGVMQGDRVITGSMLEQLAPDFREEALILRTTFPAGKQTADYSSTNPPYLTASAAEWLNRKKCMHLLLDLPSVDREMDGGKLTVHRLFWETAGSPATGKTITELVFADDEVNDGLYLLNLQVAPFENDAAPSRPVIFPLKRSR